MLTRKEALAAIKWFKSTMNMEDWEFDVTITVIPPEWVTARDDEGCCWMMGQRKMARIWVSAAEEDQVVILFHELMHAVEIDIGIEDGGGGRAVECFNNTMSERVLAPLYRKTHRLGRGRGAG